MVDDSACGSGSDLIRRQHPRPKAPKPPPSGYASWDAFEDDVLDQLALVRGFGLEREATVIVCAAAVATIPCPRIRAAVTARIEEPDGDAFREALNAMERLRVAPP